MADLDRATNEHQIQELITEASAVLVKLDSLNLKVPAVLVAETIDRLKEMLKS